MTIYDLTADEITELKEMYLTRHYDECGEDCSMGELVSADDLVTYEMLVEAYGNTEFVPDDFWCNCRES